MQNTLPYKCGQKMRKFLILAAILTIGAITSSAATFTFNTAPGTLNSSNELVDAQAVFTINGGVITIQLTDLQIDPHDASQLLSGLMFTLDQTASLSGPIVPTAPNGLVDVNSNGVPTSTSGSIANWTLSNVSSSVIKLDSLNGGPSQTVIGPTNSSFAPNNSIETGSHNPYINQEADFTISGLPSNVNILGVSFGFGTDPGKPYLPGTGGPTGQSSVTPEPATIVMALSGIGLAAIGASRRKKKAA
jgi:hypothetical protein